MYFVNDGTEKCGFYECRKCSYRFLAETTEKKTVCPLCEQDIDYEIGPGESLDDMLETADLVDIIDGAQDVERMDVLLSAAYVEDESWI